MNDTYHWLALCESKKKNKISRKGMKKRNQSACRPILQFDIDGTFIKEYPSLTEAAKEIKTRPSSIALCAQGFLKQCGGFKWKYEDD